MNYAQLATQAIAEIDLASQAFQKATDEAERAFKMAKGPHLKTLEKLVAEFRSRAFSLAEEAGKPPFNLNGTRMEPDETLATVEGIEMIWNDSNYYVYFVATWDQLITGIQNYE